MEALYDRNGRVHAWLDEERGDILDLRGRYLAFIVNDEIYDWHGHHIGWWVAGCVRDLRNLPAYFVASAGRIGVVKPVEHLGPLHPVKAVAPVRPPRHVRPVKPVGQRVWSSQAPF